MKRRFSIAAAALAALAMAACGAATPEEDSGPAAALGNGGLPDIEISAYQGADILGGETVLLSEVAARGKPIVLNFWAALCPPCRAEMPEFQRVYEERAGEVILIGVDIGPQQLLGTREEGRQLLADLGVTYPAGTTFSDTIVRDYEILGMPATYFIATDGSLVRKWISLLPEEKLHELIDELVAAPTRSP